MRGKWRLEIARFPAEEEMSAGLKRELNSLLEELEDTGGIEGAQPLKAYQWDTVFSARFNNGKWRVVYEVHRRSKFILVLSIGPRGQVYRGMRSGSWE